MNITFRSLAPLFLACSLIAVAAEPAVTGPAARLTLTPSGDVEVTMSDGAVARFAPLVAVLATRADPNIEMRWGQFPDAALQMNVSGSLYNVLTWGAKTTGTKAAVQHVEDGFDPNVDRGYGRGRTANLFAAGKLKTLRASVSRSDGSKITWDFPADDTATVRLELDLPPDGTAPRLRLKTTVKADGWYSFGYVGAPRLRPVTLRNFGSR